MRIRAAVFTIMLLLVPWFAAAELLFPASLTTIENEAFSGNEQIYSLLFPEGLTEIGDGAFSGCTNLKQVLIPDSLIHIGNGAFSGCAEALYFQCAANSAVKGWIIRNGFDYSAETVCRALIIGQTYTGTSHVLQGPANDMRAMRLCLQNMGTTNYASTVRSNLTSEEILSAVSAAFSGAAQDDISLLYYSGHGEPDGSLLGSDLENVTPGELKNAMDAVPGRKVVIVDACFSGSLIEDPPLLTGSASVESNAPDEPASSFTQAFVSAFSTRKRGAPFAENSYYVITSCRAAEESEEGYVSGSSGGRSMGLFTYYLSLGCGWDGASMRACELYADQNSDSVVTLQEAFSYAYSGALSRNPTQHALVFPAGCTAFSPFRP